MPHMGRNRFPGPCRVRQGRRLLARCLLATLAGSALPLLAAPESGRASDFSRPAQDRKSTRLNSSHLVISYAVFCLKKKIIHAAIISGMLEGLIIHPLRF